MRKEVPVQLGDRSYTIRIGENILPELADMIAASKTKGAIGVVTDTNVAPLYGDTIAQAAAAGWFALVLGCAFIALFARRRWNAPREH